MIRIYDYAEIKDGEFFARGLSTPDVSGTVADILRDVRARGDDALIEYAKRFDRAEIDKLEVSAEEIEEAYERTPKALIEVFMRAKKNISEYHSRQIRTGFSYERPDGAVLGQKITPIEKVGLYVPGGTASYPSTVLMNAIPAKIAGCPMLIMLSPPSADGKIKAPILAAAKVAGVDRVFLSGGAQAIAAMAFGTKSVPRVDKIVGPGNAYVAEAKRQVYGKVGIDMIAGPSEILVVADESARVDCVAADMLSQAEHDRMASAVLVTDSASLAKRVQEELEKQLCALPREEIARASIEQNGKIIVTSDLALALEASNRLAPEHLELCVKEPLKCVDWVKNAGSVFLGYSCPEALGDYVAGPNHTLPTGGAARFSSPLSVDDFIKKTQYSYFTPEALNGAKWDAATFARAEGLEGHARSALARGEEK